MILREKSDNFKVAKIFAQYGCFNFTTTQDHAAHCNRNLHNSHRTTMWLIYNWMVSDVWLHRLSAFYILSPLSRKECEGIVDMIRYITEEKVSNFSLVTLIYCRWCNNPVMIYHSTGKANKSWMAKNSWKNKVSMENLEQANKSFFCI